MGTVINKQGHSTNQLASGGLAVTTSDTVDLASIAYGVYVGGAGNLKADLIDGTTVTFNGVLVGTVLPIIAKRIYATGTTATNLIALL
jgi:hypothetical protein